MPQPPHREAKAATNLLRGKNVLLVEDSLIIALDAEDLLIRLGAEKVTTEGTAAGAIVALEADRPDLAILDINLGDHQSVPIADRLSELGVPYMFATGYGEQGQLPAEHRGRIVLQKPYTLGSLARRLEELLALPAEAVLEK